MGNGEDIRHQWEATPLPSSASIEPCETQLIRQNHGLQEPPSAVRQYVELDSETMQDLAAHTTPIHREFFALHRRLNRAPRCLRTRLVREQWLPRAANDREPRDQLLSCRIPTHQQAPKLCPARLKFVLHQRCHRQWPTRLGEDQ